LGLLAFSARVRASDMRGLALAFVVFALSCGRRGSAPVPSGSASGQSAHDPDPSPSVVPTTAAPPPPTSSSPSPAPDLDTSTRDAAARAAALLGAASIVTTTIDAFVLVNADGGANYAAAVNLARAALPAFFHGRFDKHPRPP
jgi:hypothetical protein